MKIIIKVAIAALIIIPLYFAIASIVKALSPSVTAVLFFSPSCGHCHQVMSEDLPPLQEQYGDQLAIYVIDVTEEAGQALYRSAIEQYQVPEERRGVPMLVVGDTVLVGSREIPERFPALIDSGLAGAGISLPAIPGLDEAQLTLLGGNPAATEAVTLEPQPTVSTPEQGAELQQPSIRPIFMTKFLQDPAGNTLAVIVLIGMLASTVWAVWSFLTKSEVENTSWSTWAVPLLALGGLFVAGYMTYIETTHSQAICGPIGNCNDVQQSPYAYVLGVLPVGVLGLLGYLSILASWILYRKGPAQWQNIAVIVCWALVWFGMIFSLYLTFLEPFVIGATCAWCITSALIMTGLLLATTGPVINAWNPNE
jgi:uncharacterized membrane protein